MAATMIYPKLEIGAGRTPKRHGWINADLYPGPNIHVAFDACGPWPFDDNSIGEVLTNHVLEHLPDPKAFFREAHRVLVSSQVVNMHLYLPYGSSDDGIGDITHLKMYLPGSFACFQPGYNDAIRNPQYDAFDSPFAIVAIYQRVDATLRWMVKPVIRHWGLKILPYLWGGYRELIVGMRALKDEAEVSAWKADHKANNVPVSTCMYNAEYLNRPLKPHENQGWVFFDKDTRKLMRHISTN